MEPDRKQPLNVTHAVLNTLTAGYQGKFVALNVFKQLSSPRFTDAEFDRTREVLDRIALWIKALMDGDPLLAGPGTETSTARRDALELLRGLREDVGALAGDILEMRAGGYVADDPEQAQVLIAALCRHAYARDHYVKGLVAYSEKFGYEEAADRWRQHLLHTPGEINLAHGYLDRLMEKSGLDQKFYVDLFDETLLLPYVFRCQMQDMNQVLSLYGEGFTYEAAGIGAGEAASWESVNARPQAACYWHAYGFAAREAAAWIDAGFVEPGMAANWKYRDFDAVEASRWHKADFSPRSAMVSKVMGQEDPDAARAWLEASRAIQGGSPD